MYDLKKNDKNNNNNNTNVILEIKVNLEICYFPDSV